MEKAMFTNKGIKSILRESLKDHDKICDQVGLNICFREAKDFIEVLNKCSDPVRYKVLLNEDLPFEEPYLQQLTNNENDEKMFGIKYAALLKSASYYPILNSIKEHGIDEE